MEHENLIAKLATGLAIANKPFELNISNNNFQNCSAKQAITMKYENNVLLFRQN